MLSNLSYVVGAVLLMTNVIGLTALPWIVPFFFFLIPALASFLMALIIMVAYMYWDR